MSKRRLQTNLGGRDPAQSFGAVLQLPGAKLVRTSQRIAIEAANVPELFGSGDPGDCFLIATAQVKKLPIVTRDRGMHRLAKARPDYLQTVRC